MRTRLESYANSLSWDAGTPIEVNCTDADAPLLTVVVICGTGTGIPVDCACCGQIAVAADASGGARVAM